MESGKQYSPRSGYAGQKFQHSQPEELAMLAILLKRKKTLGSLEIEAPRRNGYAGEGRNILKRLRKW